MLVVEHKMSKRVSHFKNASKKKIKNKYAGNYKQKWVAGMPRIGPSDWGAIFAE